MPATDAPPAAVVTPPPEAARGFERVTTSPADGHYVTAVPHRCPPAPDGAIVVCAADPDRFRMKPLAAEFHNDPVRAEVGLGGGARLDVHVSSAALPGGAVSKRVMVGLKIRF